MIVYENEFFCLFNGFIQCLHTTVSREKQLAHLLLIDKDEKKDTKIEHICNEEVIT